MPVFLVATKDSKNDESLDDRIRKHFPSDYYEVGRGQWLVAFSGTARDLYVKIVPEYSPDKEAPIKSTMIIGFGGYWGLMSRDLWDWVSTKLKSENG